MLQQPKQVEFRSVIPTTVAALEQFHAAPKALFQLTPPPLWIQVLRNTRTSLTQGDVAFRLWFGPWPINWLARHEPGPTPHSFIDRQISGPMAAWEHQHLFNPHPDGAELVDRITFAHPHGWAGLLTRLMFDGLALRFLFFYRHWRTKRALSRRPSGAR